jgi:hypothetical protein
MDDIDNMHHINAAILSIHAQLSPATQPMLFACDFF